MTLQEIYELKSRRADLLSEARALLTAKELDAHQAKMGEVDALNGEIDAAEKQLAEEGRFAPSPGPAAAQGAGTVFSVAPGYGAGGKTFGNGPGYEEAVKAFAGAARARFRVEKAAGDFLQGGVDADGGYVVPQEITARILQLRESRDSLLDEVTVIPVSTQSGRRPYKKRAQHQGFAAVDEGGAYGKTATPQFGILSYSVKKRGGYLPVTNELLEDADAEIVATAETWLADEARVTANKEIVSVITAKTPQALSGLDGILKAWIGLGSTFRATSKLLTNDDGLAWLGTLKDATGRYLLGSDPTEPSQLRLCVGPHVLPVKTYDNDTLPGDGGRIPMILGDLREGVVYWDRRQFTLKVSDTAVVGALNAFEQDLTIWRGSLRDDCTARDGDAFVYGCIEPAAAAKA